MIYHLKELNTGTPKKKNELDTAFQIYLIIVPISSNINYIHIALKDYRLI